MNTHREAITKTIRKVIDGRVARKDAAKVLRVSVRTIHTYVKKFLAQGPEGLLDHRRGHFRKIQPEQEIRIVACKLDYPSRSARWIRDRLKLSVSAEAVRQILLKHRLNGISSHPRSQDWTSAYKWDPF